MFCVGPLISQNLFSTHKFLPLHSKAVIYLMPKAGWGEGGATISSDTFIIWASSSKTSFLSFPWYHFPKLYMYMYVCVCVYIYIYMKITLLQYVPLSREKISWRLGHVKIGSNCTLVVLAHCLVHSRNSVSNLWI